MSSGRKGQTVGVDFSIAMSVFVLTIVTGIFYAIYVALPTSPFSQQVRSSAVVSGDRFVEHNSWKLDKTSQVIDSTGIQSFPVESDIVIPEDGFEESFRATSEGEVLDSQFDRGLGAVYLLDVPSSKTFVDMFYSKDLNPGPQNVSEEVSGQYVSEDFLVDNGDLEVVLDGSGIEYLEYQGDRKLNGVDMDISGSFSNVSGPLRESVILEDSRILRASFYGDSNLGRLVENSSGTRTYSFNVSSGYDSLTIENSSGQFTLDISSDGTHYTGTTDYMWFEGEEVPLGVFRRGMDVSVSRSSSGSPVIADADIYDEGSTWMVSGDQYGFSSLREFFYSFRTYTSSTVKVEGVSETLLDSFSSLDYRSVRDRLGLSGMNYNISLGSNYTLGDEIPGTQDIFVQEFPVNMMDENGNMTFEEFRVAVWS